MSKVIVTANAAGQVIVKSNNNPEYGHIRVKQVRMTIDETGFARKRTVYALIPGKIEDLKGFGWSADQEVDGHIQIREQLTPFNPKDPNKDVKVAGETGIICKKDGKNVYRKCFYSTNHVEDVLVEHDNTEEIKAAYQASSESAEKLNLSL